MSWDDVLEIELPAAKCVVVVWSENSIKSRWVKTEAMEALERECIVPVRLDGAAPPLAFRHVQILDAAEPHFSETVIRRVSALAGPPKRASATPSSGHTSIAVLPFENLSGDPDQDYFSDGITEALITSLAQIHALKVISRTSVMRFKGQRKGLREIAAELGVERIIEGSVICAGSRVRITAQLIDASSDTHEWAESFDRDLADVLAIQDEIARLVAERVSVRLTPRETELLAHAPRVDPAAHDSYLRGLSLCDQLTVTAMRDRIAQFEHSLAIDPQFAPAHAALAYALHETKIWGGLQQLASSAIQARQAAMAALLLDPTLAQAHLALATIEQDSWNWAATAREFAMTFTLNSNYANAFRTYGLFLVILGRIDEAIDASRRAVELEPLAARFHDDLGRTMYRAGRFDDALVHHRRALELDPAFTPPHLRIAETQLELGEYDEVRTSGLASRPRRSIAEGPARGPARRRGTGSRHCAGVGGRRLTLGNHHLRRDLRDTRRCRPRHGCSRAGGGPSLPGAVHAAQPGRGAAENGAAFPVDDATNRPVGMMDRTARKSANAHRQQRSSPSWI